MKTASESENDRIYFNRNLETFIRISFVAFLVVWCFQITQPFIVPVLWGAIIAVAVYPIYRHLESAMGDRSGLSATLFTLVFLILLIVPTFMLAETLAEGIRALSKGIEDGVTIPPPPPNVATWPLIGENLDTIWRQASENLEEVINRFKPQLKQAAGWLLKAAAGMGLGILKFILSIIIAGIFLAKSTSSHKAVDAVGTRLAGARGSEFTDLSRDIVRSVAQGVLGVAVIQSVLAGLGLMAAGVPGAGLWAMLVMLLAIIQLPPLLILGPIIVYVFSSSDSTVVAVLFMIWSILVSISDSFLKPLLLGRGLKTPMLVILLGAIGGMMTSGIIGLFIGSIVLALSYELFVVWLNDQPSVPGDESSAPE